MAIKIRNILPNVLAEEVAEQLDLPSGITATDNLKFKTSSIGWHQEFDGTATLIVEADSEEATDRLRAWSKDVFFEEKVVNNHAIQVCAPSLMNCDFCKSQGLNFQGHDESWCARKKFKERKELKQIQLRDKAAQAAREENSPKKNENEPVKRKTKTPKRQKKRKHAELTTVSDHARVSVDENEKDGAAEEIQKF